MERKNSSLIVRTFAFWLLLFIVSVPFGFAQTGSGTFTPSEFGTDPGTIGQLGTVLNKVIGFFSSGYMKAICTIALGGLGIGMIINRGEQGMIKKFVPWVVGTTLLLSLSQITGMIFAK